MSIDSCRRRLLIAISKVRWNEEFQGTRRWREYLNLAATALLLKATRIEFGTMIEIEMPESEASFISEVRAIAYIRKPLAMLGVAGSAYANHPSQSCVSSATGHSLTYLRRL